MKQPQGKLYLVSGGIGDADNITLRALKVLQSVDLVLAMPFVYENLKQYLTGKRFMDAGHCLFGPLASLEKSHLARQQEIKKELSETLLSGKNVAIVDFGDPLIFAPQAGYLHAFKQFSPVVIPGISSFNAANALLGSHINSWLNKQILLTTLDGFKPLSPPYPDLMVFFTMRINIEQLVCELRKRLAPSTPIAVAIQAGFSQQYFIKSTLSELLNELAQREPLPWDYLVYVGECLNEASFI